MNQYHKIVLEKGGRILMNRTRYKDIVIGDLFTMQSLSDPYEVLFFFKDKVFDHSPMASICPIDGSWAEKQEI